MGSSLDLDGGALHLRLTGIHRVLALGDGVTVPLADVTGVRAAGWDDVRPHLGWRTFGGYVPGLLATGWYSFKAPTRPDDRQFWAVFRRRDQLVVVDTRVPKPARLVVAVPDAEAKVAEVEAALSAG